MAGPTSRVGNLEDKAKRLARTNLEFLATKPVPKSMEDDRSFLARTIIQIFGYSVLGAFLLVLVVFVSHFSLQEPIAKDAVYAFVEVIKTAIVPVVTLMLGFYFGKKAN